MSGGRGQSDPQITQILQIEYKIVHTGQHYDYEMSQAFLEEREGSCLHGLLPKSEFGEN